MSKKENAGESQMPQFLRAKEAKSVEGVGAFRKGEIIRDPGLIASLKDDDNFEPNVLTSQEA